MVHNTRGKTTQAIQQFEHDAKTWQLCLDDFTNLVMIGQGGEGTVYHAKHIDSGVDVALKCIPHNESFDNEAEFRIHYQLCNHPNIVRMYGMFRGDENDDCDDDDGDDEDDYDAKCSCWIILEYCPEGTMLNVMQTSGFSSSHAKEAFVAKSVYKILLAVQYMHDVHHLMHRDIKPMNLLWKNGAPMLADFGMCAELKLLEATASSSSEPTASKEEHHNNNNNGTGSGSGCAPRSFEFVGTLVYMAPEVVALEPKYQCSTTTKGDNDEHGGGGDNINKNNETQVEVKGYSYSADSWSIGVTTHELLTGKHPFPILDDDQYTLAVRRHVQSSFSPQTITFPGFVSPEAKHFILSHVQVDPEKRMSVKDALVHPWILRHVKTQQSHAAAATVAATTTTVSLNQDKENQNKQHVKQQQHKKRAPAQASNDNDNAVNQVQALFGGLKINKV